MFPALKFPLPSRITIALAVLEDVALELTDTVAPSPVPETVKPLPGEAETL